MGFFKKLFFHTDEAVQKDEVQNSNSNAKQSPGIYTNFAQYGIPEIQFGLTGNPAIDLMSSVGGLDKEMKRGNFSFDVKGFNYIILAEQGTIKIPVVFEFEGNKYSLFYLYNEDQVSKYNFIKETLGGTEYSNTLYISTVDCHHIHDTSNGFSNFNLYDLSYTEKPDLHGDYCMWWSSPGDVSFHHSGTKNLISSFYETVQPYQGYMLGYLLSQIKMKGFEDSKRIQLPEQEKIIAIKGPEYIDLIITVSQEKGIRFHFPKDKVSNLYRDRFLSQIIPSFQALKTILTKKQVPPEPTIDSNGYDWFQFMSNAVAKEEEIGKNNALVIGCISFP